MWTAKQESGNGSDPKKLVPKYNATSDRVKAAFVVSDPVDWGRDIQVIPTLVFGNHNESVGALYCI